MISSFLTELNGFLVCVQNYENHNMFQLIQTLPINKINYSMLPKICFLATPISIMVANLILQQKKISKRYFFIDTSNYIYADILKININSELNLTVNQS